MQVNPVLAEMTRGNWIENRHRGAICVCDGLGTIIASAGEVGHEVFPRSAIKSMQALALFRSGAVEKFDLDAQAIALACASHTGEPMHAEGVEKVLRQIGCTADDLECGIHPPTDKKTRNAMRASGDQPGPQHNNCSGKHAGMLAVARALGVPTKDYSTREHPAQQLVRQGVETVIGSELTPHKCGTDGCSIPTWAAPLSAFAQGFARMATGNDLPKEISSAAEKIFDAATQNPLLVRGTETLDSDLMAAFGGRLMIKIGAEGVFCGAVRDKGLGFALKIDDGNMNAAETVVANMLKAIAAPNAMEMAALEKYAVKTFQNWRKIEVGHMAATDVVRLKIS